MDKPQRPSANKTRMKILKAARKLFLEHGFDGTSIQLIAKLAQVNTNLIFHHYRNKENLWCEVKQDILVEDEMLPKYDITSAVNYFKSILDYRFKAYEHHPDLLKLLKWQQVVENDQELINIGITSPIHWEKQIREFQKQGEIKNDIDPKIIILFIVYGSQGPFMQNIFPLSQHKKEQYKHVLLDACIQQFTLKK